MKSIYDGKEYNILSLPTKNNWRNPSDIKLIMKSCVLMTMIANDNGLTSIYLPRPGCNYGQLDWEKDVKSVLLDLLDDRFHVVNGYMEPEKTISEPLER